MLYEIATGRLPFTGESVADTIDRIAHLVVSPLRYKPSEWIVMRNKLASALFNRVNFRLGNLVRGQIFNELMTVPKWSASPPESLKAYNALPTSVGSRLLETLLLMMPLKFSSYKENIFMSLLILSYVATDYQNVGVSCFRSLRFMASV